MWPNSCIFLFWLELLLCAIDASFLRVLSFISSCLRNIFQLFGNIDSGDYNCGSISASTSKCQRMHYQDIKKCWIWCSIRKILSIPIPWLTVLSVDLCAGDCSHIYFILKIILPSHTVRLRIGCCPWNRWFDDHGLGCAGSVDLLNYQFNIISTGAKTQKKWKRSTFST